MQKYAVSSCYLGTIQSARYYLFGKVAAEVSCFHNRQGFGLTIVSKSSSFYCFYYPTMHQSALEDGVCSTNEKKSTVEQLL